MSTVNAAAFDLAPPITSAGGHVLRRGKVFHAGSYPDKAFSMTPAEMAEAVKGFSPVPLDLEHTSTVLDGHLGELKAVELSDDGEQLIGTASIPAWLDSLLSEGKRRVSLTWDRGTKRIRGMALVTNPRIKDAVLMSHFSAAPSADPYAIIQASWDRANGKAPALFASAPESGEMTADQRRRLLEASDAGREILRDEDKKSRAAAFASRTFTRSEWEMLHVTDTGRAVLRQHGVNPDTWAGPGR